MGNGPLGMGLCAGKLFVFEFCLFARRPFGKVPTAVRGLCIFAFCFVDRSEHGACYLARFRMDGLALGERLRHLKLTCCKQ